MNALRFHPVETAAEPWTVLVVDDEPGLHDVTRLVLKRLEFAGRRVRLLSAYSADEARAVIERHPDIAVAVVDVVMENDHAGLDLIQDIRSRFGRELTRIILRTGNPGMAPEREVIRHFEIDDYRDKTELTADRLYAAVYTALRAYQSLQRFKETTEQLERIVSAVHTLNRYSSLPDFLNLILDQIAGIARGTDSMALVKAALPAPGHPDGPSVVYATGAFEPWVSRPLAEVGAGALGDDIRRALRESVFEVRDDGVLLSVAAPSGERFAIWLATRRPLEPHVARLLLIVVNGFQLNIENARLHDEIIRAQREALGKLCEAVEMRSRETGQHIRRMALYSRLLAELLGLDAQRVALIEAAAPLHDIGKVSVPDAILNKPGRLDEREFAVMRAHAANGHELLSESSSAMLQLGAQIALTHHERWDGTGYPNGLAGEAIPLEGRIVALADVFDALMSKRVYKPAFPFEKTHAIIVEGAGTHFDPQLVALFDENRHRFLEIFEDNPDPEVLPG
jgi:response regulator RpfG family c-di-GMP phosphodiesterase